MCLASDSVHHGIKSSVNGLRNNFIYTIKKRDRTPIFNLSSVTFFGISLRVAVWKLGDSTPVSKQCYE